MTAHASERPPVVVAVPVSPRRRNRDRLHALDGLRGVAAFVVVLHHVSLIAQPVVAPSGEPPVGTPWWWIERTPLKLLTAGREAVIVFFVLSGLVVALPALKRVDFSWPGLLASRFVRLFLPAWASIVFASLLLLVVPRLPQQVTGGSWLARQVPHDWEWQTLVGQWSLMIGSVPQNNVLWTLRWELAFSPPAARLPRAGDAAAPLVAADRAAGARQSRSPAWSAASTRWATSRSSSSAP